MLKVAGAAKLAGTSAWRNCTLPVARRFERPRTAGAVARSPCSGNAAKARCSFLLHDDLPSLPPNDRWKARLMDEGLCLRVVLPQLPHHCPRPSLSSWEMSPARTTARATVGTLVPTAPWIFCWEDLFGVVSKSPQTAQRVHILVPAIPPPFSFDADREAP
jgi:hypothetical protein